MQLVRHCVGLLVKEVWRPWIFMVLVHKVDLDKMGSISILSQTGLFQKVWAACLLKHMRFAHAIVLE